MAGTAKYTDPVGVAAPTAMLVAASAPVRNVFATLRLLAALARALPEKRTDCLAAAAWIGALSSSWSSTEAAEAGLDGDGARGGGDVAEDSRRTSTIVGLVVTGRLRRGEGARHS